jgi:malate dehydrogenase
LEKSHLNSKRKKLSIIGAGAVGTSVAQWAFARNIADEIVIFDIIEGLPQGKALDLSQSSPLWNANCKVIGTNDYDLTSDSDVIVITAGLARKPGMTRDDLLQKNLEIIKGVAIEVSKRSPQSKIIVVTNPIDAMVYVTYKTSGFPRNRIIGMAGVLDSARYRTLIAKKLNVSPKDVTALVIGIHGDHMLPLVRLASVGGVPLSELLSKEEIDDIIHKTQHGGAEIVSLLKTGSAFITPGLASVEMAEAILNDQKRIMPCAVYLEGEFGVNGIFLGAPVILGAEGVERIIEFKLTDEEKTALSNSVKAVKNQIAATGLDG